MSFIFGDIYEGIRSLRVLKGVREKDIIRFVQHKAGRSKVANVLKTIQTLRKLVDDGILVKKGTRYSFTGKSPKGECYDSDEDDESPEDSRDHKTEKKSRVHYKLNSDNESQDGCDILTDDETNDDFDCDFPSDSESLEDYTTRDDIDQEQAARQCEADDPGYYEDARAEEDDDEEEEDEEEDEEDEEEEEEEENWCYDYDGCTERRAERDAKNPSAQGNQTVKTEEKKNASGDEAKTNGRFIMRPRFGLRSNRSSVSVNENTNNEGGNTKNSNSINLNRRNNTKNKKNSSNNERILKKTAEHADRGELEPERAKRARKRRKRNFLASNASKNKTAGPKKKYKRQNGDRIMKWDNEAHCSYRSRSPIHGRVTDVYNSLNRPSSDDTGSSEDFCNEPVEGAEDVDVDKEPEANHEGGSQLEETGKRKPESSGSRKRAQEPTKSKKILEDEAVPKNGPVVAQVALGGGSQTTWLEEVDAGRAGTRRGFSSQNGEGYIEDDGGSLCSVCEKRRKNS